MFMCIEAFFFVALKVKSSLKGKEIKHYTFTSYYDERELQ